MTANEFEKEDVVRMEKEIAKAIDFDFDSVTSSEAIKTISSTSGIPKKVEFLASYLSDLSLLSSRLTCHYPVTYTTFACLLLASIELDC